MADKIIPYHVEKMAEAQLKHITGAPWYIQVKGFASIYCDVDVRIETRGLTFFKGVYYIPEAEIYKDPMGNINPLAAPVHVLTIDDNDVSIEAAGQMTIDEIGELLDAEELPQNVEVRSRTLEDGRTVREVAIHHTDPTSLHIGGKLTPIGAEDDPLTYYEFLIWLAISSEDDEAVRSEIYRSAYGIEEQLEEVTLAQVPTSVKVVDHSKAFKDALNAVEQIAHGSTSVAIANMGKSGESYIATGSEDAASKFILMGGTKDIMGRVVETARSILDSIIKSDQADKYIERGRVWVTTKKIFEEMLRTAGGVPSDDVSRAGEGIVDAALTYASGAQLVGTGPDGKPTNVFYVVDAIRLEKVTFRGNTYRNVWGFAINGNPTVADYSKDSRHQLGAYPPLKRKKPLSLNEGAVERCVRDLIHEARNKLYSNCKTGRERTRGKDRIPKTQITIKRSWPQIFDRFAPHGVELDARKKRQLVETFEEVLRLCASEEYENKDQAAPVFIKAHSVRDPSRGGGRGAWVRLEIECSSRQYTDGASLRKQRTLKPSDIDLT